MVNRTPPVWAGPYRTFTPLYTQLEGSSLGPHSFYVNSPFLVLTETEPMGGQHFLWVIGYTKIPHFVILCKWDNDPRCFHLYRYFLSPSQPQGERSTRKGQILTCETPKFNSAYFFLNIFCGTSQKRPDCAKHWPLDSFKLQKVQKS